ncbi:MAG: hypothetical protein IJ072_07765 [Oscillospiraceae bacterium]|nr:hypothetical protein [Oscillospiraceae bacterium]
MEDISESKAEFLVACMQENLEHARHVENERLTFMSIYMAVVAGALAFVNEQPHIIRIGLTLLLIAVGIITLVLTKRWKDVFNELMNNARICYNIAFNTLFNVTKEDFDELGTGWDTARFKNSLYSFDFKRKTMILGKRVKTDKVIFAFNLTILLLLIATLIYFVIDLF